VGPRTWAKLFPEEKKEEEPSFFFGRWARGGTWLTQGSRWDQVKKVQEALGVSADGYFGSQTEEAVKKYQAANELPVDGIVGPRTWAKLFPEEKEEPVFRRGRGGTWLTQGARGEQVKKVQEALGVPADGYFGSQTEEAVKKYQTTNDLPSDGIVGPRTWAKLFPSDENVSFHGRGRRGPWLMRGARGDQVKKVQEALGIPADGYFGSQTEEAVRNYQTANQLPTYGIVGPQTWAKLFPVEEKEEKKEVPKPEVPKPVETASPKSEKPWLRRGASGEAVKEVQQAVGVDADGVFGHLTERAVKDFQFSHDLPVDGVVGPRTWAKIAEAKPAAPAVDAQQTLASMGFTDVELNTRLLRKYKGDVEQVIAEIFGNH
jgi:peptidoglycan hydrolase-like protein with peptidoglycan-binding domain